MSAAQSDLAVGLSHEKERLGIETPRHEAAPGSALDELLAEFEHTHEPIIAVDMDDVLSQTNEVVALCKYGSNCLWASDGILSVTKSGHNEAYGTDMKITDFYCTLFVLHVSIHLMNFGQIIIIGRYVRISAFAHSYTNKITEPILGYP